MTKTTASAPSEAPETKSVEITLTEFCTRLSEKVRRPELISAFEYRQRKAGVVKATHEAFQARFDEFIKTPV